MHNLPLKLTAILIVLFSSVHAQQVSLVGKWRTPDGVFITFSNDKGIFSGKQTSATLEKDKLQNGKIIGRNIRATEENCFEGTVINPENDKSYKGRFMMKATGSELELKVKWGFISFNETWQRIK